MNFDSFGRIGREVSVAFYAAITNKTTIDKGRMKAKHEVTDIHRWYQQLKDIWQHDVLMMEGL